MNPKYPAPWVPSPVCWWPLPRSVHQGQDPHDFVVDLVHQSIAFVRDHFAGASNRAGSGQLGMVGKPSRRVTEKHVQSPGRERVVGRNVQPDVVAILFRFGCPSNFQVALVTRARRAANLASTSSLERPEPARMDTLPAWTLLANRASY